MRSLFFAITLFVASIAFAQEAAPESVPQEPAETAVQEPAEPAAPAPVVAEPVVQEPVAVAEPVVPQPELAVQKSDTAKPAKKRGLFDALFPIEPDEYVSKGHFYAGATLSLIQANTEDDALNIMIGDVYEAYGYTFTVEAFGGYFLRDAMALGLRAGYSRTWFDVDFSILEDLTSSTSRAWGRSPCSRSAAATSRS